MKKSILIIGLLLAAIFGKAQNVSGSWSGILKLQNREIAIVFNVSKNGDNYVTTMDSPTQNVKGFSTNATEFNDSILSIRMDDARMDFKGRIMKNGEIHGVFTQMGRKYPLMLVNTKLSFKVEKKQVPFKYHNYSYYGDTLNLKNNIKAYVTTPIRKGKMPAVVLACAPTGNIPENASTTEATLSELSDHLTSNGFVVIRFVEQNGDASQAVDYLRNLPNVNTNRISVVKMCNHKMTANSIYTKKNKNTNKEINLDCNKIVAYNQLTDWLLKTV